jgi:peptide/nickel transport system ATP-binding protein
MPDPDILLEIKDLRTHFKLDEGILKAVDGVSLTINKHRTLGIVGESGCGKSVTAQSILRIVPKPGTVEGQILLHTDNGVVDLVQLNPSGRSIRNIRGQVISMIFQEPMTAFSPVHTIGNQIIEAIQVHEKVADDEARRQAITLLDRVGIPSPASCIDQYPYEFSGGMRQRAMIAMALALQPQLLIADEPTTALDVTVQAQILRLLQNLQDDLGMAIIFITHNLGVIANMANDVAVMYLGKVVELGTVEQVFHDPHHPYTQALMRSIPQIDRKPGERLIAIDGIVPTPLDPPNACGFSDRCPKFIPGRCDTAVPPLLPTGSNHHVRCVLYEK